MLVPDFAHVTIANDDSKPAWWQWVAGRGWALITPLNYALTDRLHDNYPNLVQHFGTADNYEVLRLICRQDGRGWTRAVTAKRGHFWDGLRQACARTLEIPPLDGPATSPDLHGRYLVATGAAAHRSRTGRRLRPQPNTER